MADVKNNARIFNDGDDQVEGSDRPPMQQQQQQGHQVSVYGKIIPLEEVIRQQMGTEYTGFDGHDHIKTAYFVTISGEPWEP